MVNATKVVGEHSHLNLRGWEGSLTTQTDETKFANDCRHGVKGITEVAGTPTESSPKQMGEEGGFDLIWLVHGDFWAK